MPRNLFDGLNSALVSAREGNLSPSEVHKIVQPQVRKYACGLARSFGWIAGSDVEDIEQEGLLIFWRDLGRYVYLCPVCGVARDCEDHYRAHLSVEHGLGWVDPKTIISSYLSSRVKAYMRAYVRNRRAGRRDVGKTVFMGDIEYRADFTDGRSPEENTIALERFAYLRRLLEGEVDERIRVAVQAWMEGLEGPQVHQRLVDGGYYGNLHSARTFLARMKSEGAFDSYRLALCA